MKKNQSILIGVLIFYIVGGLVTCLLFFRNGSLLSRRAAADHTAVSSSVEETVTPAAPEDSDAEPEPLPEPESTPEPELTPEPEPEIAAEKKYYQFMVSTVKTVLFVRETPSIHGEIVGRLKKGTQGYVLESGDTWSLIVTEDGKYTGYCFNEYLSLEEISKEDFPEEYLTE